MRISRRMLLSLLAAGLLGLLILQPAPAKKGGGGGKPGGGDPPPPTVSVRYWLKTFALPSDHDIHSGIAQQMTSTGIVVGEYRDLDGNRQPFLYDPVVDPDNAINLNDLEIVGLPAGWRIVAATDVNEYGFVVGPMEDTNAPGVWRGFLLDLGSDPPMLMTLPDGPNFTYSRRINDSMDIFGVYERDDGSLGGYVYNPLVDDALNDLGLNLFNVYEELSNPASGQPAKIIGRLVDGTFFRKTVGGALETFDFPYLSYPVDINPSGDFCGTYVTSVNQRKRTYTAFRYESQTETFSGFHRATAIDGHRDLALRHESDSRPYLYHEGTGAVPLDNIVDGSDADLAAWFASDFVDIPDMTERGAINADAPDFPGLCGVLGIPDGRNSSIHRGFVLVPIPAP